VTYSRYLKYFESILQPIPTGFEQILHFIVVEKVFEHLSILLAFHKCINLVESSALITVSVSLKSLGLHEYSVNFPM
jgi:hypothetical protein